MILSNARIVFACTALASQPSARRLYSEERRRLCWQRLCQVSVSVRERLLRGQPGWFPVDIVDFRRDLGLLRDRKGSPTVERTSSCPQRANT